MRLELIVVGCVALMVAVSGCETETETETVSDADCQASDLCQLVGQCSVVAGKCIADSDADCKASDWCKSYG